MSKKEFSDEVPYGLHAQKLDTDQKATLLEGPADFGSFTTDEEDTLLAFTSNKTTFEEEKPTNDVYLWDF